MSQACQDVTENVIYLPPENILDWGPQIKLKPGVLETLINIVGPTPDERFLGFHGINLEQISPEETWAWYIDYPDDNSRRAVLWFRDPKFCPYFKLLWGGNLS